MLPLLKPDLPAMSDLFPYLERIEKSNWYSNFGPLVREFEEAVGQRYQIPSEGVVSFCSATSALTEVLREIRDNLPVKDLKAKYCLLPAWTFVATAQAVRAAGFTPLFCDVDPLTGRLTTEIAEQALADRLDVSAVLPVVPFGGSVDVSVWDIFSDKHGVPVVIDAAASFEGLKVGKSPLILSLHATKVLGVGEGGLCLSKDLTLSDRIKCRTIFGFSKSRVANSLGANAKMSEMHAAVGIAQIKRVEAVGNKLAKVHTWYKELLQPVSGISLFAEDTPAVSNSVNIVVECGGASKVMELLQADNIQCRRWWEDELHRNPVFGNEVVGATTISDFYYKSALGVPCYSSMTKRDVETVCTALTTALVKCLK